MAPKQPLSAILGTGGAATAPTTAPATTPATPGSTGSFPQNNTGGLSGPSPAFADQILRIQPANFFGQYNITTTNEKPLYLSPTNANQLGNNAVYLAWYASLTVPERQTLQDAMVTLGLLTTTQATGGYDSTTIGAFQKVLGQATTLNIDPLSYLSSSGSGIASLQEQIATAKTKEETALNAPVTAEVSPPATLAASITNAFDQALGFAPNQDQVNAFISQIQGQQTSEYQAPQQQAQAQITQANDESSELNKLGPDGIDLVLAAYQAAVNGTKLPGAGTPQGPALGTNLPSTGGSPAVPAHTVQVPTQRTVPAEKPGGGVMGFVERIASDIGGPRFGLPLGQAFSAPTTGQAYTVRGHRTEQIGATSAIAATPGGAAYGGTYSLTQAEWKKAQTLSSALKTYVDKTPAAQSPGGASPQMQQTAAQELLMNEYNNNGGSWSQAVTTLASGSPLGKSEGTHLSAFAQGIANEVNNQITAIQNQINTSTVTTKIAGPTSSTDVDAEAAQAAKQADPAGYYAANYASWGSELSKMLYGTPLTNMENTSDTFTGPVGSDTALNAPATATIASSASAPAAAPSTAPPSAASSPAPATAAV